MLKIKDWDKFQHYKDRNPPWIKLATDTFQNYDFGRLSDASKLLALCIWTLGARSKDGSVPHDLEYIKRQCNLSDLVQTPHLKELIIQGFILADNIDASEVLADCKQSAIPETETETETEGETQQKSVRKKTETQKTKLPYENLPSDWLPFCLNEMGWNEEQSNSAFRAFYEYSTSPECKTPLRKDWFATFKISCRNGYTRPLIRRSQNVTNSKPNAHADFTDGIKMAMAAMAGK